MILQLGSPSSPAHSPSARQLEPVQHSLLGSRGEMEDLLVSTGSDVFGDPQAADPPSLPSWQSTPVRVSVHSQISGEHVWVHKCCAAPARSCRPLNILYSTTRSEESLRTSACGAKKLGSCESMAWGKESRG